MIIPLLNVVCRFTLNGPKPMTKAEATMFELQFGIRIKSKLGAGLFSVVYEAIFTDKAVELVKKTRDSSEFHWIGEFRPLVGKKSALKWIVYSKEQAKLVRNETQTLNALQHPNIVNILTAMWFDNKLAILMELSPYGSVSDWMKLISYRKCNRLTPKQFKRFGVGVCNGLKALHMAKRVHRDLHLGNVLVFDDKNGGVIGKIADFGLTFELCFDEIVIGEDGQEVKQRLSDEGIKQQMKKFCWAVDNDKRDLKELLYKVIEFVVEKDCVGEGFYVYNEVICQLDYDFDHQETAV